MAKKEFGGVIFNTGCRNFCVFCGFGKTSCSNLREQEINVAKNLRDFKKKGIKKIEISGSDPIEYERIVPLVKYIKAQGFEFVQLSTHGCHLADPLFSLSLFRAGIDRLRIPIYGSCAKIHDQLTRSKGSFAETIKGIRWFRKYAPAVEVQISSLVMQQNKKDLINMVDLARRLKINDFYFSIPMISRKDDYSYYVPIKDLPEYIRPVYSYTSKLRFPVKFMEIPFCVFGRKSELIINNSLPPNLGKYCQPPVLHRTKIKDLPAYRLKNKTAICRHCNCGTICDGFPVNDLDRFGTGKLKPVRL